MPSVPFEIPGFRYSLEASADLSAGQLRGLVLSSGQVARAGAGVAIIGVQQNKPSAQGQACEIVQTGITKGVSGAAVAQDAKVMMDANGRFITATATNFVVGYALTASGGADEVIAVLLAGLDISA